MESGNERRQTPESVSMLWCALITLLAVSSLAVALVGAGVIVQPKQPVYFALRIVRELAGAGTIAAFVVIVVALGVLAWVRNLLLGWVALASFAFFVIASIVVHLEHLELDPVELPISAYVLYTGATLQVAGINILGLGVLALAYRLVGAQPSSLLRHTVICLLTIVAVGIFLLAAFPIEDYPPPEKLSTLLHFFGALATSGPMLLLPILQVLLLKRRLGRWFRPTMVIAAYLPVHVLIDVTSWGSSYAGLTQRMGVLLILAVMTSTTFAAIGRQADLVAKQGRNFEARSDAPESVDEQT